MADTDLVIEPLTGGVPVHFPAGAARGIRHEFGMVGDGATLYRDTLDRLRAVERFRKYTLRLSCSDQAPPTLGGLWVGMPLRVHCAQELWTVGSPERTARVGSTRTETTPAGETVTAYKPVLDVRVVDWSDGWDEWAAGTTWSIDLEEI